MGLSPLEWSVAMADSEIARLGDKRAWREGRNVKWDYTAGLFTLSLLKLNQFVPDAQFVEFSKDTIGSFITQDGGIQGYKMEDYNIDNIAPGKTVIALYELTGEARYQEVRRFVAQTTGHASAHERRAAFGTSNVIRRRCGWMACSWARRSMRNMPSCTTTRAAADYR
jgi:rhamnogalacturonyl hydrolase YesR